MKNYTKPLEVFEYFTPSSFVVTLTRLEELDSETGYVYFPALTLLKYNERGQLLNGLLLSLDLGGFEYEFDAVYESVQAGFLISPRCGRVVDVLNESGDLVESTVDMDDVFALIDEMQDSED